jgi:WD40 repeat protein
MRASASTPTRLLTAIERTDVVREPSAVQIVQHSNYVLAVAFSPDGRVLATGSEDHTAGIWEVASGQQRTLITHDTGVDGVAFSPDGRLLATACGDFTARIWRWLAARNAPGSPTTAW